MQKIDKEKMERYAPILKSLRSVLIDKMERPKEVMIVEDENGQVVKEEVEESYNKEIYNLMKKCLVSCAEINSKETMKVLALYSFFYL